MDLESISGGPGLDTNNHQPKVKGKLANLYSNGPGGINGDHDTRFTQAEIPAEFI